VRELELRFPKPLDALHYVKRPAALLELRLRPQKERTSPSFQHIGLCKHDAIADDADPPREGYLMNQYVAADPSRSPCGQRKWFAALDNRGDKELTRNYEEVTYPTALPVIVEAK